MSGRLTNNFMIQEFECRDGSIVPYRHAGRVQILAEQLEILRAELGGKAITILSGYRSPAYNRRIGGAKRSQHLQSRAADIRVKGVSTARVHAAVLRLIRAGKMKQGGVGFYPRSRFVHYDTRAKPARWSQRPRSK